MQIQNNIINSSFQLSDSQGFLNTLRDLGVLNDKDEIQENEIEYTEQFFTSKPSQNLIDLLCQAQDVEYQKLEYSKKEPFSLWDLYQETQSQRRCHFYIVGKSLFYLFGYVGFVEFLNKVKIKKKNCSLWELLPESLRFSLQKQCEQIGNGIDICIHKEKKEEDSLELYLKEVHEFFLRKLTPSREGFFLQYFSDEYGVVQTEKQSWTLQKFFYGCHTIRWYQFDTNPQFYRFIREALHLKVNRDGENVSSVQLHAHTPLLLLQSLLDNIVKIARKSSKEPLSEEELGVMIGDQTHFMVSPEEGEERSLLSGIFKENQPIENTKKLKQLLQETHSRHCTKNLSALVCLTLNALRICLPYINEVQLIGQLEEEFSKHSMQTQNQSFVYTIVQLLRQKISFEKLCAAIQVVAFAALQTGVEVGKAISLVMHRKCLHLQIGTEHSFLLKWEIEKALSVVDKHFSSLVTILPNCLRGLLPSSLSAYEIVFISAHQTKQFKLAAKTFSILKNGNFLYVSKMLSNLEIPNQEKLLYLFKLFAEETDPHKQEELLSQLNDYASQCKKTPLNFSSMQMEHIVKAAERYPHLFALLPSKKVQEVWVGQFKLLKENSDKLRFFIDVVKIHQRFKLPHGAEWIVDEFLEEEKVAIATNRSYIALLGEMFINKISFEKIYATVQVLFFAAIHEIRPDEEPKECTHQFKALQLGDEEGLTIKVQIGEALKIVKSHFNVLAYYLKHNALSSQEILFIAAYHARENEQAVRLFRSNKKSEIIAQRLIYSSNIPLDEKIHYLLEVLNEQQEEKQIALFAKDLNTLLFQYKKSIDLKGIALKYITRNQKKYPQLWRLLSQNKILPPVKVFAPEKKNVAQKSVPKKQLPQDKWLALLKEEKYQEAFGTFKFLLKEKAESFFQSYDKQIAQMLENVTLESFKGLDWKTFCFSFSKKFLLTTAVLDRRLLEVAKEAQTIEEVTLLQYHSAPLQVLFIAANRLRAQVGLSKECFNLVLKLKIKKPLEENYSLNDLFYFYQEANDLIWLFLALPNIEEALADVDPKNPDPKDLVKLLEEKVGKMIQHSLTIEEVTICISCLTYFNVWTPDLARCFSLFCKRLNDVGDSFAIPHDPSYIKPLFNEVFSWDVLQEFIVFSFPKNLEVQLNPLGGYFIDRLILCLNADPSLKEDPIFVNLNSTLYDYLKRQYCFFVEDGAKKSEWYIFFRRALGLFHHYRFAPIERENVDRFFLMLAETVVFAVVSEDGDDFCRKLIQMYCKDKKAREGLGFFYQVLGCVSKYVQEFSKVQNYLQAYQNKNKPSESVELALFLPEQHLEKIEQTQKILCEWVNKIGTKEERVTGHLHQLFYERLERFYFYIKKIILECIVREDINVTECLGIIFMWTFSQFKFHKKKNFSYLNEMIQALFERFENLKEEINSIDYGDVIKLIFLRKNLQVKEVSGEEGFVKKLSFEELGTTAHTLIQDVLIMGNSFSVALASDLFKVHKESLVKIDWLPAVKERYLNGQWQERCFKEPKVALEFVQNYLSLSYVLAQESFFDGCVLFKVGVNLLKEFMHTYFIKKIYLNRSDIFSLFYSLKAQTHHLYFYLLEMGGKEKGATEKNKHLSFVYYSWLFEFFRMFTKDVPLPLLGHSKELYIKDLCGSFDMLVSSENLLEQKCWEMLCVNFYKQPASLEVVSDPKAKNFLYANFKETLKNNKLAIENNTMKRN